MIPKAGTAMIPKAGTAMIPKAGTAMTAEALGKQKVRFQSATRSRMVVWSRIAAGGKPVIDRLVGEWVTEQINSMTREKTGS